MNAQEPHILQIIRCFAIACDCIYIFIQFAPAIMISRKYY